VFLLNTACHALSYSKANNNSKHAKPLQLHTIASQNLNSFVAFCLILHSAPTSFQLKALLPPSYKWTSSWTFTTYWFVLHFFLYSMGLDPISPSIPEGIS
jgi:hypothetical protein